MGKSGYKKFLKKEKAKVKLKGSKALLPKGQNVTDTNFKVKKIVIKDQIKLHQPGEILSSRKLNLKELLSRLSHHNVSMKLEALEGLLELITKHTDVVLVHNLIEVTHKVSELTIDGFSSVRKEANKVLNSIFTTVQKGQLAPAFPLLFSYLKCGLTHIDGAVRSDSLALLDLLLVVDPGACVRHCPDLLPVCLDLVSKPLGEGSTGGRSLISLSLDSKLTADKWRARVLARVRTLLSAMSETSSDMHYSNSQKNDEITLKKGSGHVVSIVTVCDFGVDLLNTNFNLSYNNCISRTVDDSGSKFNIKEFSEVLIPVLLDTFIEVAPKENMNNVNLKGSNGRTIDVETAAILQCIADIVLCLWKIIVDGPEAKGNADWMRTKFGNLLTDRLISNNFPYSVFSMADAKKRKKRNAEAMLAAIKVDFSQPECYSSNIALANLVLLFTDKSLWPPAISYLKHCMRVPEKLGPRESRMLASCILEICRSPLKDESESLVSIASKICTTKYSGVLCPLANSLFRCLVTVAKDHTLSYLHSMGYFENWLASLPKLLTRRKISHRHLEAILSIAKKRFRPFSNSLDSLIEVILDNIPKITVTDMDDVEAALNISNLLYWVEDWDDELLDELQRGVENNYWGDSLSQHIREIVTTKTYNHKRVANCTYRFPYKLYCDHPQSLRQKTASKCRNMFQKNKTQETTENGFIIPTTLAYKNQSSLESGGKVITQGVNFHDLHF